MVPYRQRSSKLHCSMDWLNQRLSEEEESPKPGIFIGKELAQELYVTAGDVVHIINPIGGGVGIMGVPTPDVRSFRVAGIFHTGMYEYDTKWTYV